MRSRAGSRSPEREARQLDRSQAVTAWRFWETGVVDDRLVLLSPFRSIPWPVGEPLEAECFGLELLPGMSGSGHTPPGEQCRCGVYGGTYRALRESLKVSLVRASTVTVMGRVRLWGTVREDRLGWRASHAYPEQVLIPTFAGNSSQLKEALQAYDVPVEILDVRETFSALNPTVRLRVTR